MSPEYCRHHHHQQLPCVRHTNTLYANRGGRWARPQLVRPRGQTDRSWVGVDIVNCRGQGLRNTGSGLCRIFLISLQGSWRTHLNFPAVPPPYPVPVLMLHVMAAMKPTVNRLLSRQRNTRPPRPRENIGRHTYSVVLKFFVERTDFTKSLMSTNKQLNIIVNNKQRN